jgi:hypothetical protein
VPKLNQKIVALEERLQRLKQDTGTLRRGGASGTPVRLNMMRVAGEI